MNVNKQDAAAIEIAINTMSFRQVIDLAHDLGYMRAIMDTETGSVPKFEYRVSYCDIGQYVGPFVFDSSKTAYAFKADLIKRNFTDVEVLRIKK